MKKLMRRPIVLALTAVVVVIGIAAAFGAFSDAYSSLEYTRAVKGDFILDVIVRGELRAERSRSVTVPSSRGRTQLVWIAPEGQVIQEGEPVARIDITDLQNQLDQRTTEVETAETNLANFLVNKPNQIRSAVSDTVGAQLDLELAEINLDLSQFEPVQTQEQRALQHQNALLRLDDSRRNLQITLSKLVRDERRVRDRLRSSQERKKDVEEQIEQSTLRAPITGIVVFGETMGTSSEGMRKVRIGDSVHRGLPVVRIPDLSVMLVDVKIQEADYRKVKRDQGVELRIDAIQGSVFDGHLREVAPIAVYDSRTRLSTFNVVAQLDSVDQAMRPGMTASVRIITDTMEGVLYIPNRAVFEVDGETVVFPRATIPEPRKVHLGERNLDFVVVVEGLEEGEEVALTDPRLLKKKATTSSPLPGAGDAVGGAAPAPPSRP